jgi:hypothetical protein
MCDVMRQSPPNDPARIAAVIASDSKFAYFGTSAFAIRRAARQEDRRRHADGPPTRGEHPQYRRDVVSGILRSFFKYGDKTLTLFADGRAVEVPVF